MPRSRAQAPSIPALLHGLDIRVQPLVGGWAIDFTLPEQASLCGSNGEPLPVALGAGAATHRLLLLIDSVPTSPKRPARSVARSALGRRPVTKRRTVATGKR